MVVGAIAEAAAIGSIVPFLSCLGSTPGIPTGLSFLLLSSLSPMSLGAIFIGLTINAGLLRLFVGRVPGPGDDRFR